MDPYNLRWNAANNAILRHIPRNYGVGADDRVVANSNTAGNCGFSADPDIFACRRQ
jgi:hypothetical protein